MIKLGIDLDGVIRNWARAVMDVFWERVPLSVRSNEVTDWGFSNIDLPMEVKVNLIFNIWWRPIYRKMIPLRDALFGLRVLGDWVADKPIKLICVTDQKNDALKEATLNWLGQYNETRIFDEVLIEPDLNKAKLGLDWLVDDAPHNFEQWVEEENDISRFILMGAKYNQDVPALHRIKSLIEVPQIINGK